MRDEDLHKEFDAWLRPVREADPPGMSVIRRRLRRRRSRNAVAGLTALGAAAGIAVVVYPVAGGPHPAIGPQYTSSAAPSSAPATSPPSLSVPTTTSPPSPVRGGYQSSSRFTISSPVRTLVVRGDLGSVTITGSNRSTVSVTARTRYTSVQPTVIHAQDARTLALEDSCPSEPMCVVSYDVQVPRGTAVRVTDNNGPIILSSLAGPVTATAGLGDITATGLAGDTADFTDQNGQIDAAFTTAPEKIDATAALGDITLHVPGTASYHVSVQTSLGTSDVTVPESSSSPHSITATASMGAVTIAPGR
ncbi:MAG TPA: DUF4097 family beta strand repeat-containing protein [Streptosporangiaceae bacterium]|nr:DUF4097 family beta strand repeat-containing protein [Streptosporangiaceae bacterium]